MYGDAPIKESVVSSAPPRWSAVKRSDTNIISVSSGIDISEYGLSNANKEIKDKLFIHKAQDKYPFKDNQFDLVISLNCLHNLRIFDLGKALKEIERVGKQGYLLVESYRNEKELFNLQCWALTCQSFYDPDEWLWIYNNFGFKGDYEFIYFE